MLRFVSLSFLPAQITRAHIHAHTNARTCLWSSTRDAIVELLPLSCVIGHGTYTLISLLPVANYGHRMCPWCAATRDQTWPRTIRSRSPWRTARRAYTSTSLQATFLCPTRTCRTSRVTIIWSVAGVLHCLTSAHLLDNRPPPRLPPLHRFLLFSFPVTHVQAVVALCTIAILCDGRKSKGISIYEASPALLHVVFAKVVPDTLVADARRTVALTPTALAVLLQDVAAMARNNAWLVLAQRGSYRILDLRSRASTALFQYDPAIAHPIVKRLTSDEFLLGVATEGECLGMFITSSGVSSRPPVRWVSPPTQVVYQFPYVLGLDTVTELITVHSGERVDASPAGKAFLSHVLPRLPARPSYHTCYLACQAFLSLMLPRARTLARTTHAGCLSHRRSHHTHRSAV